MSDSSLYANRLLKATEELVAQARLDQIAREHKSVGSILDQRIIQPLEEIRFQTKKAIKLDIEKRLHARRGGRSEFDILSATNQAVEKFKEQGINVDSLTGNYDLEEQIWREKTRKLSYTQRRRFHQPLLHEFAQHLNEKQRAEFKEKVSSALVELAEKYRKECLDMKTEFDSSGIFHPEANAHRAHCIYLIKLNKGISSDKVEDPVLKSMYLEFLKEERFRGVELTEAQRAFLEDNDSSFKSQQNRAQKELENRLFKSFQRRKSTRAKLKPLASTKNLMKSKSQRIERAKSSEDDHSVGKDSVGSVGNKANKVEGVSPLKIFSKKLKHEKMGYMESRSVLGEEAVRLERGEDVNYKKPRDKSELLNDKLSSWMVKELQESEVNNTAIGKASSSANAMQSKAITPLTTNIAMNTTITNFDTLLSPSEYSVTKVLPFDEFFKVIQNYQEQQVQHQQYLAQQQQVREQRQSPDLVGGKGKSFSPKKPVIVTDNFAPPAPTADGLEVYSPSFQSPLSAALNTASALSVTAAPPGAGGATSTINTHLQSHSSTTKINMIQQLQQSDEQFNAYLKISQGEQLSNKLLSRLSSNLAKPKKPRRVAPLGKDAMSLTDSRGRTAKIASKGFQNVFALAKDRINKAASDSESPKKKKDSEFEEEQDEKESDIFTRLQMDGREGGLGSNSQSQDDDDKADKKQLKRNDSNHWRSSRSKSSMRGRQPTGLHLEDMDDLYGFYHEDVPMVTEDMECDLQSKLVVIWDTLSLSSQQRLTFMEKYSSSVVAAEMGHAIDQWGEVATLLMLLLECISLRQKVQEGLIILPLHLYDFLALLSKRLHPLLTATVSSLTPLTTTHHRHDSHHKHHSTSEKRFPLSALVLASLRNQVIQYFEQVTSDEDLLEEGERRELNKLQDVEEVKHLVNALISEISRLLIEKLRKVQIELEDSIPYKEKPLRDWLITHGFYNK